ncbi:MAG TPA: hypothetical protein VH987_00110 [Candidatus Limnocylindria bacterium]|jgi:hypothetical protein
MTEDRTPDPPASEESELPVEEPEEIAPAEPRAPGSSVGGGWLLVLVLLAVAVVADRVSGGSLLPRPEPNDQSVSTAFRALAPGALVLVAVDADLGTYPEIRPAVRAALSDLLGQGAGLAFVSVSVEGRAIAVAELQRLRASGVSGERLLDLGYVAGAEAALVRLTTSALPGDVEGPMASAVAAAGGGIGAFDLALLVGGTDVGPRTWVEQVGTRLPELKMVAIAPTFARPELEPYLRSGQLTALLATVNDDAAYAGTVDADTAPADRPAGGAALLAGILIALLVVVRWLLTALPRLRTGQAPAPELDEG